MIEEKPPKTLEGWTVTTLWFKRGIDDPKPLKYKVWSPPGCSNNDRIKLLEKAANQIVGLVWELVGADPIVIQGQFKSEISEGVE
ncbi:hypothetical protein LCGC14_0221200 [marine sediment metagenome]|uniref:Uncharacterized protein n=1 Tax=marine sediment metagenome TaxID=412755 RepID=A0A0F9UUR8_9ZZZZ